MASKLDRFEQITPIYSKWSHFGAGAVARSSTSGHICKHMFRARDRRSLSVCRFRFAITFGQGGSQLGCNSGWGRHGAEGILRFIHYGHSATACVLILHRLTLQRADDSPLLVVTAINTKTSRLVVTVSWVDDSRLTRNLLWLVHYMHTFQAFCRSRSWYLVCALYYTNTHSCCDRKLLIVAGHDTFMHSWLCLEISMRRQFLIVRINICSICIAILEPWNKIGFVLIC